MSDFEKLKLLKKTEQALAYKEFFDAGYKDGTRNAFKMNYGEMNEFQCADRSKQIDLFKRFGSRQLIKKIEKLLGKHFYNIDDIPPKKNDELYTYVYCVGWAYGVRQVWDKVKYMI